MPRLRSALKLEILQLVDGGTATSGKIAGTLGIDRRHVSRHLLNYRRRGLLRITGTQSGRWRKGEYIYELTRTGRRQKDYFESKFA